jgi:hypothetical protein
MRKIVFAIVAIMAASCVFAHGFGPRHHGGWGHHGGWHGPRHYGGYGYHHYHGYRGLGLAAGIVGASAATAALVHNVVAPPPVVYTTPTVYSAPAVYPTTYAAPAVVAPAPVVVSPAPVVYPRAYRRWYW